MRRAFVAGLVAAIVGVLAQAAGARVLQVGTYHGVKGGFSSIQAAVDAAKPGDWILVGPGDYKTSTSRTPAGGSDFPAAILITKKNLTVRGMNRNTVVVDGTKPGSARCSTSKAAQSLGPKSGKGHAGLNGIMIWKADNVSIENLTACNFLAGSNGETGNAIWWNGGADSGKIGGHGYWGSYLNVTSTFYGGDQTASQYGIFSSDWSGGTWDETYASNFSDSGYYIGACQQVCDQTINHAWGEYSSLGYSGSNSGGWMLIENSKFDDNKDGFDTNSQNGDNPPPQNGSCPAGVKPPVAGAPTCWVFTHNLLLDNNDPNVPEVGNSAVGPNGTGMSVSGARNDTVMDNTFEGNGAWGIIVVPWPDMGPPCTGGIKNLLFNGSCIYDDWGDHVIDNQFAHNGGLGHPTNGDIAWLTLSGGHPNACFSGNTELGGGAVTTSPATLQTTGSSCAGVSSAPNGNNAFLGEVLCDVKIDLIPGMPPTCPSGPYPPRTKVVMHPLPTSQLPTMPNPCKGVPANSWCPATRKKGKSRASW
jgi:hypothetical protein